jgi:hypothetical protein
MVCRLPWAGDRGSCRWCAGCRGRVIEEAVDGVQVAVGGWQNENGNVQ